MRCTNKVSFLTKPFDFVMLLLLYGIASAGASQARTQVDATMMLCHPAERVERHNQEYLQTEGITIQAEGSQFVSVKHEKGSIELSTPQPDYGGVEKITKMRSGRILVMGGQRSYLIKLTIDERHISAQVERVPLLYQEPCGTIADLFGSCIEDTGNYSNTLSSLFLSGYTKEGEFRSLLIGYKEDPLELTNTDYPIYLADNRNGGVILKGNMGLALFKGELPSTPCVLQ